MKNGACGSLEMNDVIIRGSASNESFHFTSQLFWMNLKFTPLKLTNETNIAP